MANRNQQKNQKISAEEKAIATLEAAKRKRENDFIKELQALEKKYSVTLICEGRFSGNNIETGIRVQAI